MPGKIPIEVYSDPVCPWCLVGLARLDKAVAKLPAGTKADIEHHAFLLDPDTPEGGSDLVEHLTQKYGRDPASLWARVEAEALKSGIDLRIRRQPMRYRTLRAHSLIRAAREKGTQHHLAEALGDAYFHQAQNIEDPEVLADIAAKFGFTRTEALAISTDKSAEDLSLRLAGAAAARGIQGVPFFVFDHKYAMSGCQPQEIFDQVIARVLAEHGTPQPAIG